MSTDDILKDYAENKRDQEKQLGVEALQLIEDAKKTFSTPHGKRILWHLLERCHVFSTTFTGNSRGFFLEGERNVGLYLLALCEMNDPEGMEQVKKLKEEMDE